jgi:hypothetical protein
VSVELRNVIVPARASIQRASSKLDLWDFCQIPAIMPVKAVVYAISLGSRPGAHGTMTACIVLAIQSHGASSVRRRMTFCVFAVKLQACANWVRIADWAKTLEDSRKPVLNLEWRTNWELSLIFQN